MAVKDKYLPSLGADGWLENKKAIMEKLFLYYIASDYNQSNTFYTFIRSLKYDLFQSYDEHNVRTLVENSIIDLYSPYFDDVNAITKLRYVPDSKIVEITIDVKCTYNNETFKLSKVIEGNIDESVIVNYDALLGNMYGQ